MQLRELFSKTIQLNKLFNFSYPYNDQILTELGNFSYPVRSTVEKDPDGEIYHHHFADTPLGLLKITIVEQGYTDDYGELVKYLSLHFTVDELDERTNKALELNNREEFRILSTVWQVISSELTRLVDKDTMVIYFDATTQEPSRDPTRERTQSSRIALYKRTAGKISKLLGPTWKYDTDTADGMMQFQWRNTADQDQQEYPNDWYKQDY